jgi:hypothetical protein
MTSCMFESLSLSSIVSLNTQKHPCIKTLYCKTLHCKARWSAPSS